MACSFGMSVGWAPHQLHLTMPTCSGAYCFAYWSCARCPLLCIAADTRAVSQSHPEELSAVLTPIFTNSSVLLVGMKPRGDMRHLCAAHPTVAAFQKVASIIDLRNLWIRYWKHMRPNRAINRRSIFGLSQFCESLLNAPLDKTMQVCDLHHLLLERWSTGR
jgi:hypothetical protein